MKLLSFDYLGITTMAEFLEPRRGGSTFLGSAHDNGNMLQRTSDAEDAPDIRYWTTYDHFMSQYEARVERAAYFHGLLESGWRKLAAGLRRLAARVSGVVRQVSGRTQPAR